MTNHAFQNRSKLVVESFMSGLLEGCTDESRQISLVSGLCVFDLMDWKNNPVGKRKAG